MWLKKGFLSDQAMASNARKGQTCLSYDGFKFGTQCLAMHECCSMQYSSVSMCMEHDSIDTLVQ